MNCLNMKLHKEIIVTAGVQLAMRQKLCITHLPMLKCYNSRAPSWYKHYQNDIIRYLLKSQDNCGSGGLLVKATRAQMAPP
jgi:hypothetical protein